MNSRPSHSARRFPGPALSLCWLLSCQPGTEQEAPGSPADRDWVGEAERASGPANARWEMVASLREDLESPRHASDGAGAAWLEGPDGAEPQPAMSGRAGRWVVVYQAGPLGIAEGGGLYLQVSPFWGWSSPQVEQRGLPGFTVVELDPDSAQDDVGALRLDAARLGDQLLGIQVSGRPLLPGERVRIDYGAGLAGAMSDKYAERAERFWVAVDGDGDGVRTVLPESPVLDVQPGPAAGLVLTLPSTLRPGETGRLTLAAVDARGNAGVELEGQVELEVFPSDGLELPGSMGLAAVDQGSLQLPFRAPREGLFLVQARGPKGLLGESNPLLVSEQAPRVLWGDLHGHSNLSDGTGTPADYYRYAREVAGLDFAALTDHDHWGMLFLDQNEAIWQQVLDVNRQQHEPGRFVTLLGFEWTSWIHGHRHVRPVHRVETTHEDLVRLAPPSVRRQVHAR